MGNVKIELNRAAVGSLLKSSEMQSILDGHASRIAARGDGEKRVYVAGTRAVARVKSKNPKKDMKSNALLKAVKG